MKILFTAHQFFPDFRAGTEVLALSVARELVARGHTVHVFTGYPSTQDLDDSNRFDQYEYEGIHVYRFHHAYVAMGGQQSLIEIGYDNKLATAIFSQVLELFQPDIVHFFHLNRLGSGLIERAADANIPAFLTPTDYWFICPTAQLVLIDGAMCSGPSEYAGNCVKHLALGTQKNLIGTVVSNVPTKVIDFFVRLEKLNALPSYPKQLEVSAISSRLMRNMTRLNLVRKVISPNQFMTKKLLEYGLLPDKIVVAAFGIDVIGSSAVRRLLRPHNQPLRLGFIGTLAPHKGCHLLIQAFRALPKGCTTLSIYGCADELPEYFQKLKLEAADDPFITFCGTFHNSKIGEVLTNLDVLVVPSVWYENTPLVIYSAQANHCPVVASNFPSIAEVIQDQLNGLLFEAGNVKELTSKLYSLVIDRHLLSELSRQCKEPKSIATYVDELLHTWKESN